jgi:hypothetical protein
MRLKMTTKKPAKRKIRWLVVAALAFLLFLTYDIIITNILAYQLCHAQPNPKTFIKKTVEFPESVYWEDNIYPGFNEQDRILMIRNYLDGVHLKTMALKTPEGAIYLYTATQKDWETSKAIKSRKMNGNYYKTLDNEAKAIAQRAKKIDRSTARSLNYSVIFKPVKLSEFQSKYLWSDEIKIIDNHHDEVIGFNRRLMRRWYRIFPDFELGNRYFYPHAMCGNNDLEGFDENVITKFSRMFWPIKHAESLDFMLFRKENK